MIEDSEIVNAAYLKRERTFVKLFLLPVVFTAARIVHDVWQTALYEFAHPTASTKVYFLFRDATPPLYAPVTYRVGIPALGKLLMKVLHISDPTVMAALLVVCFGFASLYLFYWLAVDGLFVSTRKSERALTTALFLAFAYFPVTWITPWQRPETLPTALYIGFAMLCLIRGRSGRIWAWWLMAATLWQGFVRPDVPFILGAALIVTSLLGRSMEEFGPRVSNLLKGAGMMMLAGAVQAYLQFVRFPHLSYYPGTTTLVGFDNLIPHFLGSCGLAILPFLIVGTLISINRIRIDAFDILITVASLLYFGLWFLVGVLGEVRIFVPFMMALSVVAAKAMTRFLFGGREDGIAGSLEKGIAEVGAKGL